MTDILMVLGDHYPMIVAVSVLAVVLCWFVFGPRQTPSKNYAKLEAYYALELSELEKHLADPEAAEAYRLKTGTLISIIISQLTADEVARGKIFEESYAGFFAECRQGLSGGLAPMTVLFRHVNKTAELHWKEVRFRQRRVDFRVRREELLAHMNPATQAVERLPDLERSAWAFASASVDTTTLSHVFEIDEHEVERLVAMATSKVTKWRQTVVGDSETPKKKQ